jgi:hypothetical protein
MATYFARKTGNVNATDVWATTPGGTASDVFSTFTSSDVLMANSFTITLNVNTTVGEVRTDATGGATQGGAFNLNTGITLTASVIFGTSGSLNYSGASPLSATIVGNITANSGRANHSGTGTLNVTGNLTGGTGTNAPAVYVTSTGILNVTGNVTGGTSATGYGIWNQGAGTINLTGNSTGGSGSQGIYNQSTGTCTITGQCIGGTGTSIAGAINVSTGTIKATRAVGSAYGPGNTSGLAAAFGIANSGLGVIEIEELEYGAYGMTPTSGTGIKLKKLSSNVAIFNYADTAGAKTLVDATQGQMPAASDVRDGVSYASGALTGSCKVPAAASVGFGVPVDATTGTAALTPASVWDHLLTAITTSSTIGTLLKTNIDATISSRSTATTAGIADAVWDEVLTGATHNVNRSAGKRLRQIANERIIAEGQTVSATTNTITLEPIGTLCVGQTIVVTNQDTDEKQARFILAFDAGTDTATVDSNWCDIPTAGDEYLLTTVRDPLVTRGDHPTGTVGAEIDEMYLIHGLKTGDTLTVTPTSRTAGAISQTIGGDGTNTTTVSRD